MEQYRQFLDRLDQLDALIRHRATGTPKQLSKRLAISERSVYNYLSLMREALHCPIVWDRQRGSYCYNSAGRLWLGFGERSSDTANEFLECRDVNDNDG